MSVPTFLGIPLYPASEFDWQEPAEARRAIFVQDHSYVRQELLPSAIGFAAIITPIALVEYLLELHNDLSKPIIVIFSLIFIVSPMMIRAASFFPRNVAIRKDHVWQAEGRTGRRWRFSELSGFFIEKKPAYWVLALVTNNSRVVRIGVSTDISIDAVSEYLESKGLRRAPLRTPAPAQ